MISDSRSVSSVLVPLTVPVPCGWFLMGSETGRPDERPVHRVYVRPHAAGRFPVTNREYGCFVAAGQPAPRFWGDERFNGPDQPVVGVSWAGAVAYCEWLSDQTELRFRLPTEAEWEHAALGGLNGRLYPWGDDMPPAPSGLLLSDQRMDRPAPAAGGPTNAFGISGMGWNIHEWCSDWYNQGYYASSPELDPPGPEQGNRRASRGGAWRHQVKVSRCAARSAIPPAFEYNDYGFRVFAEVK